MAQRERELEEQYKHLEEEVEEAAAAAKETSLSSSVNNTENVQKLIDSKIKEDELIQNNEKNSEADRIEDDDDDDNEYNYDEDDDDEEEEEDEEDINQPEEKTTNIIDKSNEISISNQDQKETGEANQIIKLIE